MNITVSVTTELGDRRITRTASADIPDPLDLQGRAPVIYEAATALLAAMEGPDEQIEIREQGEPQEAQQTPSKVIGPILKK